MPLLHLSVKYVAEARRHLVFGQRLGTGEAAGPNVTNPTHQQPLSYLIKIVHLIFYSVNRVNKLQFYQEVMCWTVSWPFLSELSQ